MVALVKVAAEELEQKVKELFQDGQASELLNVDVYEWGDGKDIVFGGRGNDELDGGDGLDFLVGGPGDDEVDTGPGDQGRVIGDVGFGGLGDDTITEGSANDLLLSREGDNDFRSGTGNDLIYGGDESDQLYGEDGDDELFGEGGNDELYGGEGNDTLHGGAGQDLLDGGRGVNTLLQDDVPSVTIDVQKGATQRSYIRNIDLVFDDASTLADLVQNARLQLVRYDLSGQNGVPVDLAGKFTQQDKTLSFDFGVQGIGGNRNSNAGDGYYQFSLDLNGDGAFETTRSFYRLFGDANGDSRVDDSDVTRISAAIALSRTGLNLDENINGDGVVNALDRLYATRARGRWWSEGLGVDD